MVHCKYGLFGFVAPDAKIDVAVDCVMASSTVLPVDDCLWRSTKAVCSLSKIHQHAECCYHGQGIDYGHVPNVVHAVLQAEVGKAVVEEGSMGGAEGIVEGRGPSVAPVLKKRRTVKAHVGKMPLKPGGPCTRCSVTGTLASTLVAISAEALLCSALQHLRSLHS